MHSDFTRRSVLKATVAGTALLVLPQVSFSQSKTPRRGGHLRVALAGGSIQDTLDPSISVGIPMAVINYNVRGTLTAINTENRVAGSLLESWEPSNGFKTWIFKLRKNVKFHSGKDFVADDVIGTLSVLHLAEASASTYKNTLGIVDMKAQDGHTIEISLGQGNADFPAMFTDHRLAIVPVKDGKPDITTADGTGPYKLDVFEPGVRMTFVRNEEYWDRDNAGYVDTCEVLHVVDPVAQMNALRNGEVDIISRVDLKTSHLLQRDRRLRLEENPSCQHDVFAMRTDAAPYTDANIRRAIKFGFNRQEYVDTILMGHGSLGNDQPINQLYKYFNPDLPQRQYDPDQARFYMKKAGVDSIDIALHMAEAAFPGAVDASQLFAESAKAAGINISLVREPDDGYWQNVWREKPFMLSQWPVPPIEDPILSLVYQKDSSYNETRWNNDRFEKLLSDTRIEADENLRREMYYEIQTLIHDDGGALIPAFANQVWAVNTKVGHHQAVAANRELDGLRFLERWWLDA